MIFSFGNFTSVYSMISPQNQTQIQWFSIPWIRLWFLFLKISNCPISIIISSSDSIKFKEIIKNFSTSMWIRPLFTIIPFNSWINHEIGKFILYFDSWLCVFNDLAVWIRKSPCQQWLLCEIEGGYFSFVYWKENFDFSSWMNDWEGGEGMCQLHHVYHGESQRVQPMTYRYQIPVSIFIYYYILQFANKSWNG